MTPEAVLTQKASASARTISPGLRCEFTRYDLGAVYFKQFAG